MSSPRSMPGVYCLDDVYHRAELSPVVRKRDTYCTNGTAALLHHLKEQGERVGATA